MDTRAELRTLLDMRLRAVFWLLVKKHGSGQGSAVISDLHKAFSTQNINMTHSVWDLPSLLKDLGLRADEVLGQCLTQKGTDCFRSLVKQWKTGRKDQAACCRGSDVSLLLFALASTITRKPLCSGRPSCLTVMVICCCEVRCPQSLASSCLLVLFVHGSVVWVGPCRAMFGWPCLYPKLPPRLTAS